MDAISTHRGALKWATGLLEMVTADVTEEQAHWQPPGIANPLGALYVHAICSADLVLHTLLQGKPPLFQSSWSDKTGASTPQADISLEWAHALKVDLGSLRSYAQAVYAAIDEYISSLTEEDLAHEHDLSQFEIGHRTKDWIMSALLASHINNMAGEISCLKGLQGAKGYPF